MRIFSSILLVCCICLSLSSRAAADDASYRNSILEFFKLADMEGMMDSNIDTMLKAQLQMNPSLAPLADTFKEFMTKYMSWKSLEADFVKIYMQAFTEAEFKQMLAFYKTPVGKKALREMPKLMQQGAQLGAERVQQHTPELMQALQASGVKPGPRGAPAPAPGTAAPAPSPGTPAQTTASPAPSKAPAPKTPATTIK